MIRVKMGYLKKSVYIWGADAMKMKIYIYLIALSFCFLFGGCMNNFKKLEENSILIAQKEGVANCMTYLYFQKDGNIIQKSFCFGIQTEKGKYEIKDSIINIYWDISKNRDESNTSKIRAHDIAKIKVYKDRIGHTYKELCYYKNCDTLSYGINFEVYDNDTKCIEYNTMEDVSDLSFLLKRFLYEDVFKYEDSLESKKIKNNFTLSKSYYPNKLELKLDTPIVFNRKYTIGIPLKTSYIFYDKTLMVQYHEWSDRGVKCIENFTKEAYKSIYKQLINKIVEIKGETTDIVGNLDDKKITEFERSWDNEFEHLELHLYLYDNYRIRLINYWK